MATCTRCDWNGKVRCTAFACNGGQIRCSTCSGTGQWVGTRCSFCSGGYTTCFSCGGSGGVSCSACHGTRYVPDPPSASWSPGRTVEPTAAPQWRPTVQQTADVIPKQPTRKTVATKKVKASADILSASGLSPPVTFDVPRKPSAPARSSSPAEVFGDDPKLSHRKAYRGGKGRRPMPGWLRLFLLTLMAVAIGAGLAAYPYLFGSVH